MSGCGERASGGGTERDADRRLLADRLLLVVDRLLPLLVGALLAGAALAGSSPIAADPAPRIGYRGSGEIRIGLPIWELLRALGEPTTVETIEGGCTSVYGAGPTSPIYLVVEGTLARIEIRAPGVRTLSGVEVGGTEQDVFEAYPGRVEVREHQYQDGHYLTVYSSDRRSAVVFDTDGARIRSFRIGRLPEVLQIEGCA